MTPAGSGARATLGAHGDARPTTAAGLWTTGRQALLWTTPGLDPAPQRASVTVIVESVQSAARAVIADFSAVSTVSRQRVFTATNSRR